MSMRARALPTTSGSTASRCDGFGNTSMWTRRPSGYARSKDVPRWYLTSPDDDQSWSSPSCAAAGDLSVPANSRKITSTGLRTTLHNTLRRPRCGMPTMTSVTPSTVAASTMTFMPGIIDSTPSSPKRLAVLNFVASTASNFSEKARRSSTCSRSSRSSGASGTSMRDRSQLSLWRSVMCSVSTPTVPQYVARRKSTNSRNVVSPSKLTSAEPNKPATADDVDANWSGRSASVAMSKPYVAGSRSSRTSPSYRAVSCLSGSTSARSWPRRWYADIKCSARSVSAPPCDDDDITGRASGVSNAPVAKYAAHEACTDDGSRDQASYIASA
mmetsp:Transcript_23826/g.94460  ORF Transcript_23826/g.94460 Transcript_23826/m.94460 type:complete len:328 (+) Transcript_23826:2274-3257(+)